MTVQSLRFPKAQSLIIRREVIESHSLTEIIVRILLKQLILMLISIQWSWFVSPLLILPLNWSRKRALKL